MCGRYVSPTQAEMERYWELTDAQTRNPLAQQFNVSPTALVPMIRLDSSGRLDLVAARWGLVPFWWKESKPPRNTFNARSEEAAVKPMWRHPAAKARCLVPAVGWYEWKEVERIDPLTGEAIRLKQPYFIQRQDQSLLAFAGLMSRRTIEGAGGAAEFTCAILTRDAAGPAADIHERMPIVLSPAAHAAWLDPELADPARAIELARNLAATELVYHAVHPRVNNSRSEGAQLIEPFANPA
jgi:putative SOS response-associated peptidase YedK